MPVLNIRALPGPRDAEIPRVLRRCCTELAAILGCPPARVWATWARVEPGHYVEGVAGAESQPMQTHPPIVEICAFEGRSDELIARGMTCVASVLCAGLGLDEGNAFVTWRELDAGRVYPGGAVRS